jgi:hypothetical protein
MYVVIHDLLPEFYQPQMQYLAIPSLNSLLLVCLVIPGEAVYLGTRSSKVLSSKLANRPRLDCSETKQPQQPGAESLVTILPAKRHLPPSKTASSETRLDSQLLSQRTTPLEAEPAFLGVRLHPSVEHHLVRNRSEAPC